MKIQNATEAVLGGKCVALNVHIRKKGKGLRLGEFKEKMMFCILSQISRVENGVGWPVLRTGGRLLQTAEEEVLKIPRGGNRRTQGESVSRASKAKPAWP